MFLNPMLMFEHKIMDTSLQKREKKQKKKKTFKNGKSKMEKKKPEALV